MSESKLIILTGYSGAGKDTILNMLLETKPDISRIVTHTTRPMRTNEKDKIDYHFVSIEIFEKMMVNGQLLEYKRYGEHWKGTSKKEFQKVFEGYSLIWRIDMSMAALVEEKFREEFDKNTANLLLQKLVKILIKGPSIEETLKRFASREGPDASIKEFQKRLNQDDKIWDKYKHKFPHIVINHNGKQEETLQEVLKIIDL